jgi:predicted GIY-YIG superfamily endonuclease
MIGVYKITNTANGKVYIGSTATDMDGRWKTHRSALRLGKHYNRHLQRAWNTYGEQSFTFEVVEEGIDKNDVRQKELSWIQKFFGKNCYNATRQIAGRPALMTPKPPKPRQPPKWIDERLSFPESHRVYEYLKGYNRKVVLREVDMSSPVEIAEMDYVKRLGFTAEEIARVAGRNNEL